MLQAVPVCMVASLGQYSVLCLADHLLNLSVKISLNRALATMTNLQHHLEVFSHIYSRSSLNGHSRKRTALLTATLFETPFLTPIQTLYFYILVIGHSRKRPRTLSEITTWTFSLFLSSRKRTPHWKCCYQPLYLVFNSQFHIAVRHNDFTVITVPHFSVCFAVIHVRQVIVSWASSRKRPYIPYTSSGRLREPFS